MPKKATPARSGVQRTKPKTQKSFELVRPVSQVQERDIEEKSEIAEEPTLVASTYETSSATEPSSELAALPTVPQKKAKSSSVATEEFAALSTVPQKKAKSSSIVTDITPAETVAPKAPAAVEVPVVPAKGSASARLAARKTAQRSQRNQATLITAEHYSYVRRDLAFIAVLAAIMFIAIIVLYFVPGIGA